MHVIIRDQAPSQCLLSPGDRQDIAEEGTDRMLAQQPVHEGGLSLGPINISALKMQSCLLCAPLPRTSGIFIPECELKQSHWLLSRLMTFQSLMKRPERICKTCLQTTPAEQHICLGSSSSHQTAYVFYEIPSLLPPFYFFPLFPCFAITFPT